MANMETFDRNMQNLEQSYEDEAVRDMFAKPEDDVRRLQDFWTESESLDLQLIEKLYGEVD